MTQLIVVFLVNSRLLWYNLCMDNLTNTSELNSKIDALTAKMNEQSLLIAKQAALIKYYEEQFLLAQRRRFGASSERTLIDSDTCRQLNLFGDSEEAAKKLPEPEIEEITYKRKKRAGKREEDLSGLPVERIEHELPESERVCPECSGTMRDIGVEIRRELKLIPASVVVDEHATHAYACINCDKNNDHSVIIRADSPKPLIAGSLASPSLVAHILFQKYSNGLPLYRIENGFRYDGVVISRQTMSNWAMKCAEDYLIVLYNRLIMYLRKESVIHADETTLQVLHEPGRKAQTKSYEWVYRTGREAEHQIVIFLYKETRKQDNPHEFLKDFKGFVHTDGYQAYHNLPSDIMVVGCWEHARRYWENLLKTIPENNRKGTDAERGVASITKLFMLEREFQKLRPEERYQERLKKSKPVSDAFFEWVETLGALPKSKLGEASIYAMNQRKFLENVFLDGRLELSNNRCERAVKPFVMGRKAWLFSNTPGGAAASSIIYSIVETAKANGLHPYNYIKYLLETLPNTTTDNLDALLPWSESLPENCTAPVKNGRG